MPITTVQEPKLVRAIAKKQHSGYIFTPFHDIDIDDTQQVYIQYIPKNTAYIETVEYKDGEREVFSSGEEYLQYLDSISSS